MAISYKLRKEYADGLPRAGIGNFICLTKHQVETYKCLAKAAGKSFKKYMRDITEAILGEVVPPEPAGD